MVNIKLSGTQYTEIIITDVMGKNYLNEQLTGERDLKLNLINLPSGLYLCQFKSDDKTDIVKFVKK